MESKQLKTESYNGYEIYIEKRPMTIGSVYSVQAINKKNSKDTFMGEAPDSSKDELMRKIKSQIDERVGLSMATDPVMQYNNSHVMNRAKIYTKDMKHATLAKVTFMRRIVKKQEYFALEYIYVNKDGNESGIEQDSYETISINITPLGNKKYSISRHVSWLGSSTHWKEYKGSVKEVIEAADKVLDWIVNKRPLAKELWIVGEK